MTQEITIPPFHAFANWGLRVLYRLLLDLDIKGLENVPRTGPLLIVINHMHFLDPLIPTAVFRPDVFPMAKVEVFEGNWRWMFKAYGSFPVRRGEADMNALKHAFRVLRAGHAVLMAPEGTRARTGGLQQAHEGVALIAARANAPILPVAEWGGREAFDDNLEKLRRTLVHVRIGAPVVVKTTERKLTRQEIRAITDEVMYSIAAMLPPEYRGVYGEVEKFAPQYLLPYSMPVAENIAEKKGAMPLTN
ncbi:MAG: 1-acyl-sn-glycerol-3-phosphate acyltransferase [Chloroflexi bacterium]|nr:1-acyl-sn-glycerol-3-phosphate acyltransferase [Chloroflexota bacterium]